jgi:hypothetical protein
MVSRLTRSNPRPSRHRREVCPTVLTRCRSTTEERAPRHPIMVVPSRSNLLAQCCPDLTEARPCPSYELQTLHHTISRIINPCRGTKFRRKIRSSRKQWLSRVSCRVLNKIKHDPLGSDIGFSFPTLENLMTMSLDKGCIIHIACRVTIMD